MSLSRAERPKVLVLLSLWIIAVGVLWALAPIHQPSDYHDFADQRTFLQCPHALNVISNVAFLLAGIWGLSVALIPRDPTRPPRFVTAGERFPYVILFLGITLTAFGST